MVNDRSDMIGYYVFIMNTLNEIIGQPGTS